jgi:hypothetical protein
MFCWTINIKWNKLVEFTESVTTDNHIGGVKLVISTAHTLGWAAALWLILDFFKSDTLQIHVTDEQLLQIKK